MRVLRVYLGYLLLRVYVGYLLVFTFEGVCRVFTLRVYVVEVSTGPKFPARPAKFCFRPGPQSMYYKICTVPFF